MARATRRYGISGKAGFFGRSVTPRATRFRGGSTRSALCDGDRRLSPPTGFLQHVGFRGTAEIVPLDVGRAVRLIRRYVGPAVSLANLWFAGGIEDADLATTKTIFVKFTPESVVLRDLSYSLDGRALKGAAVFLPRE